MLKKNIILYIPLLFILLCTLQSNAIKNTAPIEVSQKTLQLHDLQEITQKINRLKPLGNYLVTVPSFITLTSRDIEQFLSGVPAGVKDKRGNFHNISMLNHIKALWKHVVDEIKSFKEITPNARESLIEMRKALQIAFKHDLRNSILNKKIKTFIDRNIKQKNALIVRSATKQPLFGAKSIYPIAARFVNQGIANVLSSYFSEETINQMLSNEPFDADLHFEVILQSMIMEDKDSNSLVISGMSCSYDTNSNIPNIVSIESTFGHGKGIKDQNVSTDKYYVHNGIVYPVITQKQNRYVPDFDMQHGRLTPNPKSISTSSTLDPTAALEIARAAQLIEELYDGSVCVSFIKRDNTIYLVKIQTPAIKQSTEPTYFDPLYTKKITDDNKATIIPMQPTHELIVVKKRERLILAPNLRTFLELLQKRKKPEDVTLGIITKRPSDWSKEQELLAQIHVPVFWSLDFATIRGWIDQKKWPLVFDPQQKAAFPFKRCRGFCTLYQAIQKGILEHPLPHQLSLFPSFLPSLNAVEREQLKSEEYFPGVRMNYLFNLLKTGSYKKAEQALQTMLYRLQNEILLEEITKKECLLKEETFDETTLLKKQTQYRYIERVAFQLFQQLKHWNTSQKTPTDNLEKNFLINFLDALVNEQSDTTIVHDENDLLKKKTSTLLK